MKLFHHKEDTPVATQVDTAGPDRSATTPANATPAESTGAPDAAAPGEGAKPTDVAERFDRLFDDWMLLPASDWPGDIMHVDYLRENGALLVRATLPGLDPDNDVQLTVCDGALWIDARHQDETRSEGRRQIRYRAFSRSFPLPDGVTATDIRATFKDGLLEIRIPVPGTRGATKVPITKT